MMDVLLIADLHGNFGKIENFLDLHADAMIVAGDITNFGPVDTVDGLFSRIDIPCFAVQGNCDPREIMDVLEHSDAVLLHGSRLSLGRITFAGLGGSNPTPFGTPFELSEEEIDRVLSSSVRAMERTVHNVLVSHCPPMGALDEVDGQHVGSTSVRNHMKAFDLVCCAHIHEQRGVTELDGVKIVNPGVAAEGHCAMIHFGDAAKEIGIELLTV
ncbi:MAG: metallophosphoesterase [Methanospirillum sp.]